MSGVPENLASEKETALPVFTVCVIGRNEGSNLARCGASLSILDQIACRVETIFVDSASTDGSAELATRYFDQVIVLDDSPHLNASAGRHIGTLIARGSWVIYLDGDMTIDEEILPAITQLAESADFHRGLVGLTMNFYQDHSSDPMTIHGNRDGQIARGFGGAVVLPRQLVLDAGNWNPGLYSNEEMELYGRLRRCGAKIIAYKNRLANHFTEKYSFPVKLRSLFIPKYSILGKKFYGPGQVVSASIINKTLIDFISARPDPFMYLGFIIMAAIIFLISGNYIAIAIVACALVFALVRGGPKAPVTYLSWLPQILLGITRYQRDYRPAIARQWSRETGWTSMLHLNKHPL